MSSASVLTLLSYASYPKKSKSSILHRVSKDSTINDLSLTIVNIKTELITYSYSLFVN